MMWVIASNIIHYVEYSDNSFY